MKNRGGGGARQEEGKGDDRMLKVKSVEGEEMERSAKAETRKKLRETEERRGKAVRYVKGKNVKVWKETK